MTPRRIPAPVPQPLSSRPAPSRRGGFTLIELLIVIGLIALLIALLTPAIFGARATANNAAVRSDLGNLEAAMSAFHQEYGRMPPSYIDLRRDGGRFVDPATMATLRTIFGTQISESAMITSLNTMDFPGQAKDYSDRGVLRGAECLVLFLGGLPASGDVVSGEMTPVRELAGWSKNPRDPFNVSAKGTGFVLLDKARRQRPFYEFKPDRLKYVGEIETTAVTPTATEPGLSYFTYLDQLEGQTAPLIYASSDGGRGYRDRDVRYSAGAFQNPDGTAALASGVYQTPAGDAINPNGFQLISPGPDGDFGQGGEYGGGTFTPAAPGDGGEDNITNFASGALGDG